MESTVRWDSGMAFRATQNGHELVMDAAGEAGGRDLGPRPKVLLLTALVRCTGMDVVSILAKMRVDVEGFEVRLSADQTEEHPKVFKAIHVQYVFRGRDLPMDKLQRAVELSREKYCGVSAMLAKACPITHEIVVEA